MASCASRKMTCFLNTKFQIFMGLTWKWHHVVYHKVRPHHILGHKTCFPLLIQVFNFPLPPWALVVSLLGASWVLPSSIGSALFSLHGSFMRKRREVWRNAPLCIFWCDWKERNRSVLKGLDLSSLKLKFLSEIFVFMVQGLPKEKKFCIYLFMLLYW